MTDLPYLYILVAITLDLIRLTKKEQLRHVLLFMKTKCINTSTTMPTKWPRHSATDSLCSMGQRWQISCTAVTTDYVPQLRLQRLHKRKKETYQYFLDHVKFQILHVYVCKTVYYNYHFSYTVLCNTNCAAPFCHKSSNPCSRWHSCS